MKFNVISEKPREEINMKKIRSAHIVAIVFGIILLGGIVGFFNLNSFIKPVVFSLLNWNSEKSVSKNITDIENSIENLINENVGFRTSFIQANGLAQKLMGKKVVEDVDPTSSVIKLDNGYISFLVKELSDTTLENRADKITDLNDFLSEKGIDFLYIQAPYKIAEDDQKLPTGLKDYAISNAQKLCSMLDDNNITVLNLINNIQEQNKDWYSLYYRTDHHWTNEAGFWAYGEIAGVLSEKFGIEIDEKYYDATNYSIRKYEKVFLGTQGKRVGSTYSGLDDISFLLPDFETSLKYQRQDLTLEGDFDAALLFDEVYITGDIFKDFCYESSMGGNYGYIKITNNLVTNGKKVLLIKDSYANVVAPYLALGVSELEVIDLRYFESEMNMSVTDFINESNPDIVLMLYNCNALKDNSFFNY